MPLGGRIASASTSAAPTPSSPPMDVVEKVTPAAVEAVVLATQADSIVVPSSSIVAPLLCVGVTTTSALVSTFDKNLIRSAGVYNATVSAKVFLERSLAILEEIGLQHQETM